MWLALVEYDVEGRQTAYLVQGVADGWDASPSLAISLTFDTIVKADLSQL